MGNKATGTNVINFENKLRPVPSINVNYFNLSKLADFGFARLLAAESMATTLCGSPLYMAPEILRGDRYDAKADLWSLGAILYELITSRPPFRAQNHIELLRKIEKGDGWIRFPGDAMDEMTAKSREFHGISRQTGRRKTIGISTTNNSNLVMMQHIGSLGSSPKFSANMGEIPAIPEDLKELIRKLLQRNPVQRITFEEFFMCPCVVLNRKSKTKLSSSPVPLALFKTESSLSMNFSRNKSYTSPGSSVHKQSSLSSEITKELLTEAKPIDPPFPFYGTNAIFDTKQLDNIVIPQISQKSPPNNRLKEKGAEELEISNSVSSVGSSFGSFEFSDEDVKKRQESNNVSVKKFSSMKNGSEEFIVVDTRLRSSSLKSADQSSRNNRTIATQKFANSPVKLPETSTLTSMIKQRPFLFDSQMNNTNLGQINIQSAFTPIDQSYFQKYPEISGKLTFLPTLPQSLFQEPIIMQLVLQTIRAQCILEFTKKEHDGELRIVLIHVLELLENIMAQAQKIARDGYLVRPQILENIAPIVSFISSQFNECLTRAEEIITPTTSTAAELIYKSAVEYSRRAAQLELEHDDKCELEYVKTILILEGLLFNNLQDESVIADKLLVGLYSRLDCLKLK